MSAVLRVIHSFRNFQIAVFFSSFHFPSPRLLKDNKIRKIEFKSEEFNGVLSAESKPRLPFFYKRFDSLETVILFISLAIF